MKTIGEAKTFKGALKLLPDVRWYENSMDMHHVVKNRSEVGLYIFASTINFGFLFFILWILFQFNFLWILPTLVITVPGLLVADSFSKNYTLVLIEGEDSDFAYHVIKNSLTGHKDVVVRHIMPINSYEYIRVFDNLAGRD